MRILINTASNCTVGGVQVAKSVIEECLETADHEFLVVLSAALAPFFPWEKKNQVQFRSLDYRPVQRLLRLKNPATDLQRIENEFQPDVVFTTSGPAYWRPRAPHLMGFNLAHNIYSESPFFGLLSYQERLRWFLKKVAIRYFMKHDADAWVVQTDDINQRLRKWLKRENVHTVSNTASSHFREFVSHSSSGPPGRTSGDPINLLVLSSYYLHKNLEIVNQICNLIRQRSLSDIRFTMTLPDEDFKRVIEPANRDLVSNVGKQRPQDCPPLYLHSDVLFLPTLLECFSANYVEAMCMSRPIITTDMGFAQTICRDAALYFEPLNASAALERILELKRSPELYQTLIEAGQNQLPRFGSPRDRMAKYLQICQSLVGMKPGFAD